MPKVYFNQLDDVDFTEAFSLVVKASTVRTILTIALSRGSIVKQLDVSNTFLHAHLAEIVYMQHPSGYEVPGKENYVCHLKRSLYG